MARGDQRLRRAHRTARASQAPCPPRRRRHHPGARPYRVRGRDRRAARSRAALGPHEVPGRGGSGAPGAGPGPGGDQQRRPPVGDAQAPRRDRADPRADRHARHVVARAARRGRRPVRRGPGADAEPAAGRRAGRGPASRSRPRSRRRRPRRRRAPGGAAGGRLAPAGQPLPRPGLLGRQTERGPGAPPGHLGAARAAVQLVRTGRRGSLAVHGAARAVVAAGAGRPHADAPPGAAGRRGRRRTPELPARRRTGPGQDGAGAARRAGGERLPAARGRAERRQDQLGPRGRALDPHPVGHRDPRQRRHDGRLRRHRRGQLRGARPPRGLDRRLRLPRHGRRRGALHQEQELAALAARAGSCPSASGPASRGPC